MNQDKIHIDSALRQLLENHRSGDKGNYEALMARLAEHQKTTVPIDEVLDKALEFRAGDQRGFWRRVITLIWFRRLRNAGLIILLVSGIGYIVYHSTHYRDIGQQTKEGIHAPFSKNDPEEQPASMFHKSAPAYAKLGHTEVINSTAGKNDRTGRSVSILNETTLPVIYNEEEAMLSPRGLGRMAVFSGSGHFEKVPYLALGEGRRTRRSPHFNGAGAFIIGFNFSASFQNCRSTIISNDPRNLNRNYDDLANNGNMRSLLFNYGISMEYGILGPLGISFGVNKLTVKQQQEVDFLLTEAPVYDIDGSIAGYIAIQPEMIRKKIENRVDYVSVPLNLTYSLALGAHNSIQFKGGTSVLSQVGKQTAKFDYKSLDLENFDHKNKKISMNTGQFGIAYTRALRNGFMFSIGFERQLMNRINPLSDNTERIKTEINNFTFSLKYKL